MLNFRNAMQADLYRIVEIYNSTIPGRMVTADTEFVTVEDRRGWLAEHCPQKRPLWMVEEGGVAMGWAAFSRFMAARLTASRRNKAFILILLAEERGGEKKSSVIARSRLPV